MRSFLLKPGAATGTREPAIPDARGNEIWSYDIPVILFTRRDLIRF